MRYRRRDPNRDYGPGTNSYEDPDYASAMSNYGAAVRDMDPADRPDFLLDEWVGEDGGPSVPGWVPEPATTFQAESGWGTLPGHRNDHCMSQLPGCRGECGG